MQREITTPCNIFEENGEVMQAGWARTPVFIRNDEQSKALSRHCERLCWVINSNEAALYLSVECYTHEFSVKIAVADLKRGGMISDYITKKQRMRRLTLPSDSLSEFYFDDRDVTLHINNMFNGTLLKCEYADFAGLYQLNVNIFLKKNQGDSLSELAPFERNRKYYYLKRFQPCYSAQGVIKVGGLEYSLNENNARAYLDGTRFYKPREHNYQRLCADSLLGDKRFSLCLASRVGDNRYGNENCFFYDGKLEKLSQITVKGSGSRIDRPFYFKGGLSAVDIMFKPFTVRGEAMCAQMGSTSLIFGRLFGSINRVNYDKPLVLDNMIAHLVFAQF